MGGRFIFEVITRIARNGRSAAERVKREFEDIIVWAKLVKINGKEPKVEVSGRVIVRHKLLSTLRVGAVKLMDRAREVAKSITVSVARFNRR